MITKVIGITPIATTDNRKWDRRQATTGGKKKTGKPTDSKAPIAFPSNKVFLDA